MTEAEAKALLLRKMQQIADREYPVAWVGDLISEDEDSFCFEAGNYAEGENPREDPGHWYVNKADGGCEAGYG